MIVISWLKNKTYYDLDIGTLVNTSIKLDSSRRYTHNIILFKFVASGCKS